MLVESLFFPTGNFRRSPHTNTKGLKFRYFEFSVEAQAIQGQARKSDIEVFSIPSSVPDTDLVLPVIVEQFRYQLDPSDEPSAAVPACHGFEIQAAPPSDGTTQSFPSRVKGIR